MPTESVKNEAATVDTTAKAGTNRQYYTKFYYLSKKIQNQRLYVFKQISFLNANYSIMME